VETQPELDQIKLEFCFVFIHLTKLVFNSAFLTFLDSVSPRPYYQSGELKLVSSKAMRQHTEKCNHLMVLKNFLQSGLNETENFKSCSILIFITQNRMFIQG